MSEKKILSKKKFDETRSLAQKMIEDLGELDFIDFNEYAISLQEQTRSSGRGSAYVTPGSGPSGECNRTYGDNTCYGQQSDRCSNANNQMIANQRSCTSSNSGCEKKGYADRGPVRFLQGEETQINVFTDIFSYLNFQENIAARRRGETENHSIRGIARSGSCQSSGSGCNNK